MKGTEQGERHLSDLQRYKNVFIGSRMPTNSIKEVEKELGTATQHVLADALKLSLKELKREIRDGEKAKDKMVTANLRLVVSLSLIHI